MSQMDSPKIKLYTTMSHTESSNVTQETTISQMDSPNVTQDTTMSQSAMIPVSSYNLLIVESEIY